MGAKDSKASTVSLMNQRNSSRNMAFPQQIKTPLTGIEEFYVSELNQCSQFVGYITSVNSGIQVNSSLCSTSQITLNHPYNDPDVSAWVRDDANRIQYMQFEQLRNNDRFTGKVKDKMPAKQVQELSISSLFKQYANDSNENLQKVDESFTLPKSAKKGTVSQLTKLMQLQKNENFTDIDDYLQNLESDFTPREKPKISAQQKFEKNQVSNSVDYEFSNRFRKQESIQFVSNSQTSLKSIKVQTPPSVNPSALQPQQFQKIKNEFETDIDQDQNIGQEEEQKSKVQSKSPIFQYKVAKQTKDKKNSNVKFYGSLKQQVQQKIQTEQNKYLQPVIDDLSKPIPVKKAENRYLSPIMHESKNSLTSSKTTSVDKVVLPVFVPQTFKNEKPPQSTVTMKQHKEKKNEQESKIINTKNHTIKTFSQIKSPNTINKKDQQSSKQQVVPSNSRNSSHLSQNNPTEIIQPSNKSQQKPPIQQPQVVKKQLDMPEISNLQNEREQRKKNSNHFREGSEGIPQITGDQLGYSFGEKSVIQQAEIREIRSDIVKLTDRMNLAISPSYVNKSNQKGSDFQSSSNPSHHGETVQSFGFDDLPEYNEPAIIEFSLEQLQSYKKK